MPRPGGRPTKFSPSAAAAIIEALEAGCYIDSAAAAAGISRQTLNTWKKYGVRAEAAAKKAGRPVAAKDKPFVDFLDAIKKASAVGHNSHVMNIRAHSEVHWQASAWFLERKYPEQWGRTERHQLSGPEGKPIQSKVSMGLTPQTAEAIRGELLGIGKEGEGPDDEPQT